MIAILPGSITFQSMTAIRSDANADLICERIAAGFTLRQIARELNCEASSITQWVRDEQAFATRYARAREAQTEHYADEIIEISEDGSNDWMERETEAGGIITAADHEHISRSKLRVDTRKWLMSKRLPKVYGDRMAIAGDPAAPLEINLSITERAEKAREMIRETFAPKEEK